MTVSEPSRHRTMSATSWLPSLNTKPLHSGYPLSSPLSHHKPAASPTSSVVQVVIKKSPPRFTSPIPVTYPTTMHPPQRERRTKPRISYEISSESEGSDSSEGIDSSFSGSNKRHQRHSTVSDIEEDEQVEEIEPQRTPPPRMSAAGHSLRQRSVLNQPLRARENGDRPRNVQKRKTGKSKSKSKSRSKSKSVTSGPTAQMSERIEIRHQISTVTAAKRANFFVAKKDMFLPLLPEQNHIQRLADQRQASQTDRDLSTPYVPLENQPSGVTADMKPYQLLGLSFLVYLHQNGLSGILGDEMGLGKTLQTLSLIQYLKEKKCSAGAVRLRPSVVICPLSVLNSWMAESRRWTPDLKVLRFHGPINERNRLKQIATGEIDFHGNQTGAARRKMKDRRTANGKPIIDLESEDGLVAEGRGVDIVVTTYEGFLAEQGWFKRAFVWNYVILDEGHKIKNDLSLISKALQGLGAEYRLMLTGTPLQNNLLELWALLHWLYPEVFTVRTQDLFKESFDLTKGQVSTKVMDDARRLLETIMLRRMKNSPGVDLNLPPKTEVLLYVPLTPMQRFWYMRLLTKADQGLLDELFHGAQGKEAALLEDQSRTRALLEEKNLDELDALGMQSNESHEAAEWKESKEIMRQALEREQEDEGKNSAWRKLMNLLMQLRKCCNHPYILPHAEPDPYYLGEHIIHASAKFIVLDKIINELVLKQERKVIVFSGFTRMLDCCEDFLALRGGTGEHFKYVRLDGSTPRARRNLGIRMFNQESSEYRVILISTRAGGLGINLATASDVILLDQDWNPQIMLQAEARAHRIGQNKAVTVYKLCTQGTVEEQMMGRIQKKLYLSAKVTESMRDIHNSAVKKRGSSRSNVASEEDMPSLDTSQLMSLIRRGAQTLARPELDVNEMLSWNWETMLEKCKDKPADYLISEQTQVSNNSSKEEDEKKWLAQIEHVKSRVFDGKQHKTAKDSSEIAREWSREERRIGKNTTVMVDGFAISKESMKCGDWEAVPTMAGKDPRLAEPEREKKAPVVNQEHCQVCWDGGNIVCCSLCPRSFHYICLDPDAKRRSKGKMNFSCTQHQCFLCQQKTSNAGGMIYRCRWCERGYCEDCLDWEKTDLLGENLPEYELLGFPAVTQAFYIKCPDCADHHLESEEARIFCQDREKEIDEQYQEQVRQRALIAAAADIIKKPKASPSSKGSLTEAPTLDSSGISTPHYAPERILPAKKQKRKEVPELGEAEGTGKGKKPRLTLNGPHLGPFDEASITKPLQTMTFHDRKEKKQAKRPTI